MHTRQKPFLKIIMHKGNNEHYFCEEILLYGGIIKIPIKAKDRPLNIGWTVQTEIDTRILFGEFWR